MTNKFRKEDPQYNKAVDLKLPVATNNTVELIQTAMRGLNLLYRPGYSFKKVGITVTNLVPQESIQYNLFDNRNRKKDARLMNVIDDLNAAFGRDTIKFSMQLYTQKWKLKMEKLFPPYIQVGKA